MYIPTQHKKFRILKLSVILIQLIPFPMKILSHSKERLPSFCYEKLSLESVVACTLEHSPEYRSAKYDLELRIGQKRAAQYYFPNNPVLSTMASQRTIQEGRFPPVGTQQISNGEILLSQEIYLGGKRETQLEVADSQVQSSIKRLEAAERTAITEAILTYIQYQSAKEENDLAKELVSLAEKTYQFAKRRYQLGLAPAVDEELALADLQKARSYYEETSRRKKAALTDLWVMMGLPYTEDDQNLPKNLGIPELEEYSLDQYIQIAKENRPDYEALSWEAKASEARRKLIAKEKIPNLTISGFVQNDGFNERVIGARVSFPLPIVRDYSAEILQAKAASNIAQAQEEVGEHTVRSQAIKAWNNYMSWKKVYEDYTTSELSKNYQETIHSIQRATERGDLSVRDSLLLKRPFIEYKTQRILIRREFAAACLEYIRAAGLPFQKYIRRFQNEE